MRSADVPYHIVDEPTPSRLERLTVNPIWPFFASMFAGAWLAWPWFAVNAFALGQSRLALDASLLLGGFFANAAIVLGLGWALQTGSLSEHGFQYALLLPQAVRMLVLYLLYLRQQRTFELFQYFGGIGRNGVVLVLLGAVLRSKVLASVPGLWVLLFA